MSKPIGGQQIGKAEVDNELPGLQIFQPQVLPEDDAPC